VTLRNSTKPTNWRQDTENPPTIPVHHTNAPQDDGAWSCVVSVKRKRCNACEICGALPRKHNALIGPLQGHHRLLRAQGGPDIIENCMLLCAACHRRVHESPELSYEQGWMIRSSSALGRHMLAMAATRRVEGDAQ
jgi:5-methylcytosine-specific restriction endonuclease McrA